MTLETFKLPREKVRIEVSYEGWAAFIGSRQYRWDHNDGDMGTEALAGLLEDLGHEVEVKEVC